MILEIVKDLDVRSAVGAAQQGALRFIRHRASRLINSTAARHPAYRVGFLYFCIGVCLLCFVFDAFYDRGSHISAKMFSE